MKTFLDDRRRYEVLQAKQYHAWEARCGRCGACCGAYDGDPCEHLVKDSVGKYSCNIYDQRFGERRTRSGKTFHCVPIRDILYQHWPGDQCCGYKSDKW